jgi:hypothetical protein
MFSYAQAGPADYPIFWDLDLIIRLA